MWEWYRIGLAAGLGAGLGIVLSGWLASTRAGLLVGLVVAVAGGALVGLLLDNWNEALAGGVGGILGCGGAAQLVRGTLRRGGTRVGTGALVGLAGLVVAALAFVPVLGYLLALAVPALAARLRGREEGRYAGLRILARD